MPTVQHIHLSDLVNSTGVTYGEFRKTLTPRRYIILLSLFAHHISLLLMARGVVYLQSQYSSWLSIALIGITGGAMIGYTLSSVANFFHEAAHYNIVPGNKKLNELVAKCFINPLIGLDVQAYRPIHFAHHRHLGTPLDEEVSYFDPLNFKTMYRILFLGKIFDLFRKKTGEQHSASGPHSKGTRRVPLSAALLHLAIIVSAAITGQWALIACWVSGVVIFLPFFQTVRQTLEHRALDARDDVDYRIVPHGEVTRLFGDGAIASTLGSAGFNRHLLHHWEPQISYTRLRDVETFLLDTDLAPIIKDNHATYLGTFVKLFKWNW